jgi:Uma2 family endonuclease
MVITAVADTLSGEEVSVMTSISLPPIEDLDVDDLASLPEGYRYELHGGNLVILTPSSFWHKELAWRICTMLRATGAKAFENPGVRGKLPRDCRLPDVGVVTVLPPGLQDISNLPGTSYSVVVEIVSERSKNGEYTGKAAWYAQQGIPEYWIVDQAPGRPEDDGLVQIHRLTLTGDEPAYVRERNILLSDLEVEYRSR